MAKLCVHQISLVALNPWDEFEQEQILTISEEWEVHRGGVQILLPVTWPVIILCVSSIVNI